jgi:hypothetical protein
MFNNQIKRDVKRDAYLIVVHVILCVCLILVTNNIILIKTIKRERIMSFLEDILTCLSENIFFNDEFFVPNKLR